jgi:hypothetical protein
LHLEANVRAKRYGVEHPESHRLSHEIPATGASTTEVAMEALRERWLRGQRGSPRRSPEERARLIERALPIAHDCAARLAHAGIPDDTDLLPFDDRGLPHDADR